MSSSLDCEQNYKIMIFWSLHICASRMLPWLNVTGKRYIIVMYQGKKSRENQSENQSSLLLSLQGSKPHLIKYILLLSTSKAAASTTADMYTLCASMCFYTTVILLSYVQCLCYTIRIRNIPKLTVIKMCQYWNDKCPRDCKWLLPEIFIYCHRAISGSIEPLLMLSFGSASLYQFRRSASTAICKSSHDTFCK